jgi:hypothetical protein
MRASPFEMQQSFRNGMQQSFRNHQVVRAHQDASGGKGGQRNALGRSRRGFSTKLHAVVDTQGRPICIAITPGQRHEMIKADELLERAPGKAFIADTG